MNNVRSIRGLALRGVAALGLIAMTPALAESNFASGPSPSASARLDFQVNIPEFISLRVGTAGTGNIDTVSFDVAAANVGDGSDVAATGGDVSVALVGNVGDIELTATTTGPLSDGTDSISFAEILTASSDAGLDSPTLADAASTTVTVTPNVGTRIVNRTADWSFDYSNTDVVAAGTYVGQVTYTAAKP